MPAIEAGVSAPEIKLHLVDGREFSLNAARKQGPVVAAFFKVSCPVCQLAFPYLERLYKAYGGSKKFVMVGISQDDAEDTGDFNRRFGVTFPTVLDDTRKFPASNAYGLTNVPSVFLISAEGEVEFSSVAWSKRDFEQLNQRLAEISGISVVQLFKPGEQVSDYKPG